MRMASMYGASAYPVDDKRAPAITWTLSRSTSFLVFVSPTAGIASSSSMMISIRLPPALYPISSKYNKNPFRISRPFCAFGPDNGAMNPIRIGPRSGFPVTAWLPAKVPAAASSTRTTEAINRERPLGRSDPAAPFRSGRSKDRPLRVIMTSQIPQPVGSPEHRDDIDGAQDEQPALGVGTD